MNSDATSPAWDQIAEKLIRAIDIARKAYEKTRRRRPKLADSEIEHIRMSEMEISRYLRRAREAIANSTSQNEADAEWRQIVLNLFRAHSLTWEVLWALYEGMPQKVNGSDIEDGEELTQHVIDAVCALSAGEGDLLCVDWNGRAVYR